MDQKKCAGYAIAAFAAVAILFPCSSFAASQDQVSKLIEDVKNGPAVYYTPEAAAHFASLGSYAVSGLSVNKGAATLSFVATIKLGGVPLGQTKDAIPALIDVFPKAIHYVEIKQSRYAGEGTFDDCVSTYVMSAKNQFMLSSPFLDYNGMSQCDTYIEGPYETEIITRETNRAGVITSALFNIKITFTFYAGECALSRITGMGLGHDPSAWRQWWLTSSSASYSSPTPVYSSVTSPATAAASSAGDFSDILAGGKYRVVLNTGDDFTGTVESRDAVSMVFETTEGKPYSIQFSLLQSYLLIQAPPPPVPPKMQTGANASSAQFLSYDELKLRASQSPVIDVQLTTGSLFRGKLVSIDDEGMKLDIEGSTIPLAKNVVKQIIIKPQGNAQDTVAAAPQKPAGPLDTLWIKNIATDKFGKPGPDLLHAGTIMDEGDNYVTLKNIEGGSPQKFSRNEISRYIRHSSGGNSVDDITRYAKPLACPAGMVLVDMPPGMTGKPFFKVCIDKFEYPNKAGNIPRAKISFEDAKNACAAQGKRLCTAGEWQWACSGMDGLLYPYGKSLEQDRCNADTRLVASGEKINCSSPFGAYDMVGNVFEWVTSTGDSPALMGGPYSKCQTVSQGGNGDAKPQSGLRCCKSN